MSTFLGAVDVAYSPGGAVVVESPVEGNGVYTPTGGAVVIPGGTGPSFGGGSLPPQDIQPLQPGGDIIAPEVKPEDIAASPIKEPGATGGKKINWLLWGGVAVAAYFLLFKKK
jgi:hypothetical protein